jgi:hypothetical protein
MSALCRIVRFTGEGAGCAESGADAASSATNAIAEMVLSTAGLPEMIFLTIGD